jgi:aminobenzoyl-glutamate utilization protein A
MVGHRWTALRRDLHNYPEVGFTEFRTASLIAARLRRTGYRVRLGPSVMTASQRMGVPSAAEIDQARQQALACGSDPALVEAMGDGLTGVVAEMQRGEGPVIALRFDMDALPIEESSLPSHLPRRMGFASKRPGYMHACGHDGHATIGLVVAELAASAEARWRGTLRLIFQPAEEGGRGAWPMVDAGVVDDADWFFAFHIGCDLPSGKVASRATNMMFSSKWDSEFRGVSAHAAGNPELGRNALLAAAQAAIGLHALPRHGTHATHVNVGTLHAGSARNAVADLATLQLELRANAEAALVGLEDRARQILEGSAMAQGCSASIVAQGRTIGEETTPLAAMAVADAARSVSRAIELVESWPIGGGDDAAFFMKRVKERGGEAAYFIVGSNLSAGHHHPEFDFVEDDMGVAVEMLLKIVEKSSGVTKQPSINT